MDTSRMVFKMKSCKVVSAKGYSIFVLGTIVFGIVTWMFYTNTNHYGRIDEVGASSNSTKLVTNRNVPPLIVPTKNNRSARLKETRTIKTNTNHHGRIDVVGATNTSTKLVTNRIVPQIIAPTKNNRSARLNEIQKIKNLISTKWFVYLVQTPQCLQQSMLTNDFVGNETLCHCDVIVLSYQNECRSSLLHHVEYVHYKHRTTWAQGRNLLWLQAKRRHKQYKYYIFMDDDVELRYKKIPGFKRETMNSPLRAFEIFLLNYEPVVGVVDYFSHHSYRFMLEKRQQLCKKTRDLEPMYVSVTHFDAIFNAFHYKAMDFLLPYNTKYDHLSWWDSQRYIITKVEIIFRGQAVMFAPVYAANGMHRPYPRNGRNSLQVWRSIAEEIEKKLPIQYRGMKLVKEFKSRPIYFSDNSKTVCLNLPAHFPIVPFQHFAWKSF